MYPAWEGGPAEGSGSHSFLSHFRQAGNRCRLGLGWAGPEPHKTTPNPRTVTCKSVNQGPGLCSPDSWLFATELK